MGELQYIVEQLQSEVASLRQEVQRLKMQNRDYTIGNSMKYGNGDYGMRMNKDAMWFGKNLLSDAEGVGAADGTILYMDGRFKPKDGISGTYTGTLGSIVFVDGVCVNIF